MSEQKQRGILIAQPVALEGEERGSVFIIENNLGGLVCAALPWPSELKSGDFSRVIKNANDLVRAVNCHDDLVAALKECVNAMHADNPADGWLEIIQNARATIAKAEATHG